MIARLTALNRLSRDRAERPAVQTLCPRANYVRCSTGSAGTAAVRATTTTRCCARSLIWTLGEFGDEDIFAEAKRRFAGFLQDPKSLPSALRDAVTHLVGVTADRATYDTLLALARKSTVTNERVRYYLAAASARDAELASATLALTLTDEVPGTIVTGLIGSVAGAGEQPDLAWEFVQRNFDVLLARQGPQFRDQFVANFMTNFSDEAHAAELASLCTGPGDLGRPGDDGSRAGNDRDLGRSQGARAAGGRCLDQGAKLAATPHFICTAP